MVSVCSGRGSDMLGIGKKVEKVRADLYSALVAKANELIDKQGEVKHAGPRALALLDLADVIRKLGISEEGEG